MLLFELITHTHIHTHARTHSRTHAHTHARTDTHQHTHTHTPSRPPTTHTAYTRTHARARTDTDTDRHTHTHTHTHTHYCLTIAVNPSSVIAVVLPESLLSPSIKVHRQHGWGPTELSSASDQSQNHSNTDITQSSRIILHA